jgi:hypothetical protein
MLGNVLAQLLFIILGVLGFFCGEFNTPTVIFTIGCFMIVVLLDIVAELRIMNRNKN